jgi:hypothetical protein
LEESDPAKKVICTKPGGSEVRRGRPMLRWCDELKEDVAQVFFFIEIVELMHSQERSGGISLRRLNPTQGRSINGRRRI